MSFAYAISSGTIFKKPFRHWLAGLKEISMAKFSKRPLSFGVLLKISGTMMSYNSSLVH